MVVVGGGVSKGVLLGVRGGVLFGVPAVGGGGVTHTATTTSILLEFISLIG